MSKEPKLTRGPLGNILVQNEIAGVHITINGDELTWKRAAEQLRIMADAVEAKSMGMHGFSWKYGGDYELEVIMPEMFGHGDHHDGEGNLVHVAEDEVITVIWANKGAESETLDPPVSAVKWAQEHGPLTPAWLAGEDDGGDTDGDTGSNVHPLH